MYDGDKGVVLIKNYNATNGDVLTVERSLYDGNGLYLGSFVYDSTGNKVDTNLKHYIKEYSDNGDQTVTLYDNTGIELGTVKYSDGYCQDN